MLHQALKTEARLPVGPMRRPPPALRQCCDCYVCPVCEQIVELTDFRQIVWHQRPGHEPMEMDD